MIRAFAFFVLLAVAISATVWVANHPGDVMIDWQGYRIETSLALLGFAIAVACVVAALLFALWQGIRHLPGRFSGRMREGRQRRGVRALTEGMVALAAGDARAARRAVRHSLALLDDTPLTLLLAAQSAQLAGDDDAARTYFAAMAEDETSAFLGLRGLIGLAVRSGDGEAAAPLIERARKLQAGAPWLLSAELDLLIAERQWPKIAEALQRALKANAIDASQGSLKRATALLESARAAAADGESEAALRLAEKAHKQAPDLVPASTFLASLLDKAGSHRRAGNVLRRAWGASPHPELAAAYVTLLANSGDALERVKHSRKLYDGAPDHLESAIALARAALDARLWGEARSRLGPIIEANRRPSRRVCLLMAELEEKQHDNLTAARQWFERAAMSAPEPAWVCGGCGSAAEQWTALCGNCGAFAALSWHAPGEGGPARLSSSSPALLIS